jgi:hypothetical protein
LAQMEVERRLAKNSLRENKTISLSSTIKILVGMAACLSEGCTMAALYRSPLEIVNTKEIRMRLRFLFITLLFCCTTLFAAESPFSGTWKLNVEKSHMTPPAPKSSTAQVENVGDNFKLNQQFVDDKDATTTVTFDAKTDGKDYPVTGDSDHDAVAIQKVTDHKLKLTIKKGGKVVAKETVTVSKDGQTTTLDYVDHDAEGKEQKGSAVYDKQ